MSASNWAHEQSTRFAGEVPDFYLARARRVLDPCNTPPDYVDAYRTLAELCPKAADWALDKAAREIADG